MIGGVGADEIEQEFPDAIESVYPELALIPIARLRALIALIRSRTVERLEKDKAASEAVRSKPTPKPRAEPKRPAEWQLGKYKSETKWKNQMNKRGWSDKKVSETIAYGKKSSAPNKVNPNNQAARYEYNGKYVVRDEVTKEILQVSDDGFIPNK